MTLIIGLCISSESSYQALHFQGKADIWPG